MRKDSSTSKLSQKGRAQKGPAPTKGIDELIERKKEALGIKPLEASLKNYRTVIKDNQKLMKQIEEQKLIIKKMRQERVEHFKEIEQAKENQKKLEHIIKHDTPARSRKNRSSFRNDSRDNSNVSNDHKTGTKSPNYRYGSEMTKTPINPAEALEAYKMMKKSDTVKHLEPKSTQPIQQPKIGGKDHSEVITTELLKKSTQELMQNSFSNYKEIQKISKMENFDERNSSFACKNRKHESQSVSNFTDVSPSKKLTQTTKTRLKMGKAKDVAKFSPVKDDDSVNFEESLPKAKLAFERKAEKLNKKRKEMNDTLEAKQTEDAEAQEPPLTKQVSENDKRISRNSSMIVKAKSPCLTMRGAKVKASLKLNTVKKSSDPTQTKNSSGKKIYRMSNKQKHPVQNFPYNETLSENIAEMELEDINKTHCSEALETLKLIEVPEEDRHDKDSLNDESVETVKHNSNKEISFEYKASTMPKKKLRPWV